MTMMSAGGGVACGNGTRWDEANRICPDGSNWLAPLFDNFEEVECEGQAEIKLVTSALGSDPSMHYNLICTDLTWAKKRKKICSKKQWKRNRFELAIKTQINRQIWELGSSKHLTLNNLMKFILSREPKRIERSKYFFAGFVFCCVLHGEFVWECSVLTELAAAQFHCRVRGKNDDELSMGFFNCSACLDCSSIRKPQKKQK